MPVIKEAGVLNQHHHLATYVGETHPRKHIRGNTFQLGHWSGVKLRLLLMCGTTILLRGS